MKRRNFLKLLAASLIGAGVTINTIANVFSKEHERCEDPGRMAVAEALRLLAEQYKAGDKANATLSALKIISEAHRDFALVWASGAVNYWIGLCGSACLPLLCSTTKSHRDETLIAAFLGALKQVVLESSPADQAKFLYEADTACAEMGGRSVADSYSDCEWRKGELKRWHPKLYAQTFLVAV